MKAALVEEYQAPVVVRDVPDPVNDDDGVIIEVKACGVCRSDWHGWQGEWPGFTTSAMPHILGHEFVGEVVEVGSGVTQFEKGARVIIPFTIGCGSCWYCRTGHSNVCTDIMMPGFTTNGGFAQYVHVGNADLNLVRLPDAVPFVDAAGMGCRFMTAYHGVIEVGKVHPGDWVVVYGAGGVGLSATQIASAAGANVIAVDIADDKLELARKVGAVETVNSSNDDPVQAVMEHTHGGADMSVDALGIPVTVRSALASLRPRGTHVQIGMTTEGEGGEVPLTLNDIIVKEISYRGSFGMPAVEFRYLLNEIATNKLRPGELVTGTIDLSGVNDALVAMTEYRTLGATVITDFTH